MLTDNSPSCTNIHTASVTIDWARPAWFSVFSSFPTSIWHPILSQESLTSKCALLPFPNIWYLIQAKKLGMCRVTATGQPGGGAYDTSASTLATGSQLEQSVNSVSLSVSLLISLSLNISRLTTFLAFKPVHLCIARVSGLSTASQAHLATEMHKFTDWSYMSPLLRLKYEQIYEAWGLRHDTLLNALGTNLDICIHWLTHKGCMTADGSIRKFVASNKDCKGL